MQGLSNEQLNNSTFIDNFTADNKKLVDISINPTANMTQKNITTMLNSMSEPQMKLLAFNKIYYEITKKEGRDRANAIMEELWNGALYLHDFPTATFLPYCYIGEEMIQIKYNNEIHIISFEDLYELLKEKEIYDEKLNANVKYPNNLYVKDIINEEIVWTKITRILNHPNSKPLRFFRLANGLSQIVTEDHPVITINRGDIAAKKFN